MLNFALAALSVLTAAVPAEVRLAWKFREGDVLRYRILQDVHQSMSGMGTMETETRIGQVLREKVLSVAKDGTAKIDVAWEALRFHVGAPMGGAMDFDSTKEAPGNADGQLSGLTKLVGSGFQLEMKPNGEIVSLQGIDELMKTIASGGGASGGMMGNIASKSFNDVSMKRALETVVLPDQAVADGATWHRQSRFEVPSLGKLEVEFDFKLEGMEDVSGSRSAKLGVLYSMGLAGGKPDMSAMPGAQRYDVDLTMDDAKGEGTIHFSPELGRMMRTELASDMDIRMLLKPKGEAKPGTGEGVKLAILIHQELTTSLLGPSDPPFEAEAKPDVKK